MRRPLVALALVAIGVVACSKKDGSAKLAPVASSLAVSSADPSVAVWHYAIDPASTTHVDMPGLEEHIQGDTTAAAGTVDVVPADLAKSRGTVEIDLATFSTHTFGNDDDATQTRHARTWLEAQVDGKTNEAMRWAVFAIRSVDGLSAHDLTRVPAVKDGADEVRTVTATVHGDLLVHGHEAQKDDAVEIRFYYPSGAAADAKPTRIEVTSKAPMRVVLEEHDVTPRDPAGKVLAWTTKLVSKVAEFADVTVNLVATPSSS